MKDYNVLDDIVSTTQNLHRDIFDKGYDQGYKDGKDEAYKSPVPTQDAYQQGLDDAWECAKKIALNLCDGGIDVSILSRIFGVSGDVPFKILKNFSAQEAIGKIKEYEEKTKQVYGEINVGDEVITNVTGYKGVVVGVSSSGRLSVLFNEYDFPQIEDGIYRKTGRHYDGIEEILKAMRDEE